jgi:hypothetical protein
LYGVAETTWSPTAWLIEKDNPGAGPGVFAVNVIPVGFGCTGALKKKSPTACSGRFARELSNRATATT